MSEKEFVGYCCPKCKNATIRLAQDGPLFCYSCGWRGELAISPYPTPTETIEAQLAAVTAERDALAAQLAALKKRVADAPRGSSFILESGRYDFHVLDIPSMKDAACETQETITYALLRLEDGET